MEETKPIWASKTFWTNVIGGGAMIASAAGMDLGLDEDTQTQIIGGILAVANVILRFVTTQPVTMK